MRLEELLDFIKEENKRLKEHFTSSFDDEKRIFAQTIKINEEVGELCDAILDNSSLHRKDKLKNDKDNLEKEFADVIITTLLLADQMNIDIVNALKKKVEIIKNRKY